MLQVDERAERERAGDAVGGQAHVQLEAAQRIFRVNAEDAVGNTAGKAQRRKRLLQSAHIGAVEKRHAQKQVAVAQLERGINELRPNRIVHLGARLNAAIAAQRRNGVFRFGAERASYLVFC